MTPEDKRVLIQWALSLVNVCLGAAIGIVSAVAVADRNAKHAAGAKLRAAFAPELALMRGAPSVDVTPLKQVTADPQTDLSRVLEAAYPRHAAAVAEYRFYVPVQAQAGYDAAWRAYHTGQGSIEFHAYVVGQGASKRFCERVEAIFEYSEMRQARASRVLPLYLDWRKPGKGSG